MEKTAVWGMAAVHASIDNREVISRYLELWQEEPGRFRLAVNLYGAPALSKQEFAGYRQDLIVGASLQVAAPLGQYDPDRLVNIGTNRWFFKPEIGVSKALGAFTLEFSTALFFYTTNHDYFGGKALEQDPVSSTQAHVIYSFGRGVWAAVHGRASST